jgi:hypothetical protein
MNKEIINLTNKNEINNIISYDNDTTETYRIKRLFKIDPLTDIEVPDNMAFKFLHIWDPYTGKRSNEDPIGPLYFDAINLYDYYFNNRFRELWYPPAEQYQGYYGDLVGTGKNISIKSRGSNPEKYLFRLPILDCYLPSNHNLSFVTYGPELTDNEITQIDNIINKFHPKRNQNNFTSLTTLKFYYDCALNSSPDLNSDEIKDLKLKYPNLSPREINEKYNRYWVDKLVKIKYN